MNPEQVEHLVPETPLAPTWGDVADASAEAQAPKPRIQHVTRLVRVPLTGDQWREKAEEQSSLVDQIAIAKNFLKEEASRLRDEVKALEGKLTDVALEVRTGHGQVEVHCTRTECFERNAWLVTNTATGEALPDEAMEPEERQLSIEDALTNGSHAVEPEDLLAMAREAGGGDDEDDETTIDDPEALLEGAAEEEAPKKRGGRKARG